MGLFNNIFNFRQALRYANNENVTRSIDKLADILANSKNNTATPHFLDLKGETLMMQGEQTLGLTDNSVSPIHLYDMMDKDTYIGGLFDSLVKALFKNDHYIRAKKDADGKYLGDQKKAEEYTKQLLEHNYRQKITILVSALFGAGGGNALVYAAKDAEIGLTFDIEPFLTEGSARVRIYSDARLRKIMHYEVIDQGRQRIFTLDPKTQKVKHVRYQEGSGSYKLSTNPAKKAVYWYILKMAIAGSNLSIFQNGLQDAVISSPDFSALTSLVSAMSGDGKVSASERKEYLTDPLKYLARLSIIDDRTLAQFSGDPRESNRILRMKFPQKFERVGRTNETMKAIEFLQFCDKQMGYAYRTSQGIINTQDSKYDNAEVERDNWLNTVVEPLLADIEALTDSFIMTIIDPDYDTTLYEARFGRDPNSEDIEIYRAKTDRNRDSAQIIMMLQGTDYIYDVDQAEIVQVSTGDTTAGSEIISDADEDIEDKIDKNVDAEREKKLKRLEHASRMAELVKKKSTSSMSLRRQTEH